MRLTKKNSIIVFCGMLFIIAGGLVPGTTKAAAPSACTSVVDITDGENIQLANTDGYSDDFCFSFTVGSDPLFLTLTLIYEDHGGTYNGAAINLDMMLYNSSGFLKTYTNPTVNGNEVWIWGDDIPEPEELTGGETYYVRINAVPDLAGYPYSFKWFDQDNTSDPPTITVESEDPADGAEVLAGGSGQYLAVEVADADSCAIHYGTDTSVSASVAGTINGAYCETTVPYGTDMTNDGTNYWYVEATNTVGDTRYPDTPDLLSFTVRPAPEVLNPSPADGASVSAGVSGQLLRVTSYSTDSCTIYYGTDTSTSASVVGTLSGDYCEATIPYGANMTNDGTNYWYVEATNTVDTTRYPSSGTLSFTVSFSNSTPVIAPMLMLLLKGEAEGPPTTTTNPVIVPWLMLLL